MLPQQSQTRKRHLLAAISGLLMILATPPIPLAFHAWFGLVPYFKALQHAESRREAFSLGFTFAIVWHAGTVYWIAWNSGTILIVSILSAIALACIMALWFAVVGVLHRWLLKTFGDWAHFLAIILYMASDIVWQHGDLTFPWITFALTQANSLEIVQLASLGGSVMITGWIVLLNAILTVGQRRWPSIAITVILIAGCWFWGRNREQVVHEQTDGTTLLTVAIVQGNIDPDYKYELGSWYSLNMYDGLSSANVSDSVDLIIWPENAAPVYVEQDYRWRRYLQKFVNRLDATLITGGRFAEFHEDNSRTPYNAAFMIAPHAHHQFETYRKVYLVPMGERIPFQWLFPFLGTMDFGQAEFEAGEEIITWDIPVGSDTVAVTPLICYEAIFPEAGWKASHLGADLLVNMTNDGWFTGTGQQLQHLLLSRMRSVETGRSLARATNTGISAFVTPSGRIAKTIDSDQRGVIIYTVEAPIDTPFIRGGWRLSFITVWAAVGLLLLTTLITIVKRLRGT